MIASVLVHVLEYMELIQPPLRRGDTTCPAREMVQGRIRCFPVRPSTERDEMCMYITQGRTKLKHWTCVDSQHACDQYEAMVGVAYA